jgi:tetratricopeptide (TPR) repeat protein
MDAIDPKDFAEAEQYKLQAEFILHKLQANLQVYGTNSAWSGADPADVELALKYINRSLEHLPDNPAYLNLKALLLIEGGVDREGGVQLLKRAHELAPRDITIQDNYEKLKAASSSSCFIATAAYGSEWAPEVDLLRAWRDESLLPTRAGRHFVALYYRFSPPVAALISPRPYARAAVRRLLTPVVHFLRQRSAR